jgi:hypothetical protein
MVDMIRSKGWKESRFTSFFIANRLAVSISLWYRYQRAAVGRIVPDPPSSGGLWENVITCRQPSLMFSV